MASEMQAGDDQKNMTQEGSSDDMMEDDPHDEAVPAVDDVTAAALAAGLLPHPREALHPGARAPDTASDPAALVEVAAETGAQGVSCGAPMEDASAVSSSDTSDMSDDEEPAPAGKPAGKCPGRPAEEPADEEEQIAPAGTQLRTKNEISPPVPLMPEVEAIEGNVEKLGIISSIIEESVVIQADCGPPALDEGTVVCFDDKSPLGVIAEIFGPIQEPLYLIRFGSVDDVRKKDKAAVGVEVYYAVTMFKAINKDACHVRGSDASNIFDEEPAEDEVEYSDDEQEAEARKRLKALKGLNKRRQADVTVENAESMLVTSPSVKARGPSSRHRGAEGEFAARGVVPRGRGGSACRSGGRGDGSDARGGMPGGAGFAGNSGPPGGSQPALGAWGPDMRARQGGYGPPFGGGEWGAMLHRGDGPVGRGGGRMPLFTPEMFAGPPMGMTGPGCDRMGVMGANSAGFGAHFGAANFAPPAGASGAAFRGPPPGSGFGGVAPAQLPSHAGGGGGYPLAGAASARGGWVWQGPGGPPPGAFPPPSHQFAGGAPPFPPQSWRPRGGPNDGYMGNGGDPGHW